MNKLASLTLALMLALTLFPSALAQGQDIPEDYGSMGNLTRMNITADELNEFLAESLVKLSYYDKFVDYDTVTGLIMALNAGEIAVIGIDTNTAKYIASRNEHFVTRIPNDGQFTLNYSMLFREENRELCEKVSGIIREMKNDGSLDALKKAYIDDVIVGSNPEKIVPEFFEGAETIRVAVTGDLPPMDYISPDGVPMGFNTALIAQIASRLKINVELVNFDSGARAIALASGAVDVIFWSQGANFDNWSDAASEDRPEGTIATESYLTAPNLYVVLDSSPLADILEPSEE